MEVLPKIRCKQLYASCHYAFDEAGTAIKFLGEDGAWHGVFIVPEDEWEKHHYPWGQSAFLKSKIGRLAQWLYWRFGRHE